MAEKPPTTTHEVMMEMATEVVKHAIESGVSTCARRTWEEGWGARGSVACGGETAMRWRTMKKLRRSALNWT